MVKLITPMSNDNFSENWAVIDAELRTAKKKYITSRVASFFSNMVFALLALFATNCMIHDHMTGSYCDFLEDIPYLLPLWEKLTAFFLKPGQSWQIQVLLTTLAVYSICFVVCALFVLIVLVIYHPFKRTLPTGSVRENAAQMLSMAKDARRYANRSGANGSMLWALVFMMFQFGLIALYWLIELEDTNAIFYTVISPVMALLEPLLKNLNSFQIASLEMSLFTPSLMLFCLGIYLFYALLNHVHALSVQFMYKYHVPYSFVADVEYYYVFADEDFRNMTEEDVQAWLAANADSCCEKAMEMELLGAYGKAKELYAQAAHSGSASAMEHYARHWLIMNAKDPAKYWLMKCVATGKASETAVKNLRRLKWRRKIRAEYLK